MYSYLLRFLEQQQYDNILLLMDSNFLNVCWDKYTEILRPFNYHLVVLNPIDFSKDIDYFAFIAKLICNYWFSRKSLVMSVWGWFVWDLWGVLSGMYMRWIDFLQIWTTLMAQSDAIIGKVWINVWKKKNLLGLFYSPVLTICDVHNLYTLDRDEFIFAMSEIFKHQLINPDADAESCMLYLDEMKSFVLQNDFKDKSQILVDMVYKSLLVKKFYVEKDPYDKNGLHKWLSLWHVIANVIETLNLKMRHGEAVWLWLYISLYISICQYPQNRLLYERLREYIRIFFNIDYKDVTLKISDIMLLLKTDKISCNGSVCLVVLENIGKFHVVNDISLDLVKSAFNDVFTVI